MSANENYFEKFSGKRSGETEKQITRQNTSAIFSIFAVCAKKKWKFKTKLQLWWIYQCTKDGLMFMKIV